MLTQPLKKALELNSRAATAKQKQGTQRRRCTDRVGGGQALLQAQTEASAPHM